MSIDEEAFYPSVRYKLVEKAVKFFSENLTDEEEDTIKHCLDMIKFGMGNTLITFRDQYYEYDGGREINEKGLTIGGYESAWLADLAGAYILENTQQHFKNTSYYGIYRDDGFAVFKGKKTYQQIVTWRNKFQSSVSELADGDCPQFTCDAWLQEGKRESPPEHNKALAKKTKVT